MSGFDATWLSLREPADRAARAAELVATLVDHLRQLGAPATLLDIGCGTGSTWAALAASLPEGTLWHLLDHDPALLEAARRRIGATEGVRITQHDLNDLADLPLHGVSVVTASALFDLCSEAVCARLVDRVAAEHCGLYAALTYNGVMRWSLPHPLDDAVTGAFNRHQRTDKGLGPALGPDGTACLAHQLRARGYRVSLGDSPWRMGPDDKALQRAFLAGFEQPLREIGTLSDADIGDWLAFRQSAIATPGSLCEVGHTDLLALPG